MSYKFPVMDNNFFKNHTSFHFNVLSLMICGFGTKIRTENPNKLACNRSCYFKNKCLLVVRTLHLPVLKTREFSFLRKSVGDTNEI